ncbi:hypothetical protein B1207_04580 [Legionella quinlivanii]|uniref:O-GlcNAc transferase C-terminal domain-containing protein n=1 Tax=Legionella quinlivanii TaxID=45073 RepID=A0A364LL51_9GAMM|nr:hypothetical protein [Legionella quinlivanii]RAP37454.1 hypothetical protein B1207_04580 [Legionella quinlivanii]
MIFYNFIKKVTPPKAKKCLQAILRKKNNINFAKTFGLNRSSPDDLMKLWQFAEGDCSGQAEKIYRKLSRLKQTTLTNYTLSALATLRLNDVTTACGILEKGITIYPEDHWLRLYYLQTCAIHNHFQRYFAFMKKTSGEEITSSILVSEFYRKVIDFGMYISFLINYRDIKEVCSPEDFKKLQQYFITELAQKPIDFQTAKNIVYQGKHLNIEHDFYSGICETIKDIFQNLTSDSQKIIHNLNIIETLTLPFIPADKAISEFIESCKLLARESITLTSPSKDLLLEWVPWQSIFTSPDAGSMQYPHAMQAFEQFAFSTWPELNYTAPHTTERLPASIQQGRKIKIGFIVYDFIPMMSGLLSRLDKKIFDTVYLFPGKESNSQIAESRLANADRIIVFPADDSLAAIKIIAEQKLDIIVSAPCTLSLFFPLMARLAHLQMILLEPNWTNGLTNADYYISWKSAEPVKPDVFYKTAVSYLEHPPYWIERPSHNVNTRVSEKGRSEVRKKLLNCGPEKHIYLCANTPPKVHPLMDEMLIDLLKADPHAMIAILRSDSPSGKILKARLKNTLGQNFNRVIFLSTLSKQDAHSLLMSVDCCLDSFPLCGMSSSFDAIMLGVPIVTLPFDIPFSKWTASIYGYIGVSGLIARNQKEYIEIAMRVAADKAWRHQKAQEIREKASMYVESTIALDELQSFIIRAWERKLANLPPSNWINGDWQDL